MKSVPLPTKGVFRGRRGILWGPGCKVQRCGAQTRKGTPCQKPAEVNPQTGRRVRCRLHGAKATGAKTPEGKAKLWRHGRYSKAYQEAQLALREKLSALKVDAKRVKT
jgi:hypothetical protein